MDKLFCFPERDRGDQRFATFSRKKVKRLAQRAWGTLFFLLMAASTLDVANAQAGTTTGQDSIGKLQADINYLINKVDELTRQAKQAQQSTNIPKGFPESPGSVQANAQTQAALRDLSEQLAKLQAQADAIRNAQQALPAQLKRLEARVDAARSVQKGPSLQVEKGSQIQAVLTLLAITALLAASALLLGLWQLRILRALLREWTGTSNPVNERADLPLNNEAPARNISPEMASRGSRGKGGASPAPPRHQKIAKLLARLRQEAPRLAEGFGDPSLKERFLGELNSPMEALLGRLKTYSELDEPQFRERWLERDLVPALDALARFYSEAVEEGRQGRTGAKGLARKLRTWLYDRFSRACQDEGWFAIDPVDPYKTDFDPQAHHAVANRDVEGATGKVIAVQAIGRRDAKNGSIVRKAEVIVGR